MITSVQVGGKDVIYVRQHQSSPSSVAEVQKLMEGIAEKRFRGQANGHNLLGKDKVRAWHLPAGQLLVDLKCESLT